MYYDALIFSIGNCVWQRRKAFSSRGILHNSGKIGESPIFILKKKFLKCWKSREEMQQNFQSEKWEQWKWNCEWWYIFKNRTHKKNTVKPVVRDHPFCHEKLVLKERLSLNRWLY